MRLIRWFSVLPLRLRVLFGRARAEEELDEEVRYHLDRKTQMYMAQGLSNQEARLAALRDFGGVEPRKEDCRDARGWVLWIEQAAQDSRYALRGLRRAPGLVSAQMAVTFVMVTGAVLFGRSLGNLANIDPGFDRHQLVALTFNPVASGYAREEVPALQRRLLERVRTQPGIAAAAVSFCPLAAGCRNSQTVSIEDYQPAPDERVQVQVTDVGADYFTTVGMDLLEGRAIDARDVASASAVVVINERTAKRYFGGRSPIGQRLARGSGGPFRLEIVGLVRDARTNDLTEEPVPTVFAPLPAEWPGPWVIHARVTGDPQIGIRLTFGAMPGDIVRQVIAEGGLTAGIGIAAGALLALWATRFVGAMLYGVSPSEPTLYVLVAAGLVASVILACLVPAGRAARVDPAQALRAE